MPLGGAGEPQLCSASALGTAALGTKCVYKPLHDSYFLRTWDLED